MHEVTFFLTLEKIAFYSQIISYVVYIAGHTMKTSFFPQHVTNLAKNVLDYVEY